MTYTLLPQQREGNVILILFNIGSEIVSLRRKLDVD